MSLLQIPQELLEEIALSLCQLEYPGPPSTLFNFTVINRAVHTSIGLKANPLLYSKLFSAAFDIDSIRRRSVGHDSLDKFLSEEWVKRYKVLAKIKADIGLNIMGVGDTLPILTCAYVMMLENCGKNLDQLCGYADLPAWLQRYWLNKPAPRSGWWDHATSETTLAMWLSWFLLQHGRAFIPSGDVIKLFRMYAFGAHKYCLSIHDWTEFHPRNSEVHRLTFLGEPHPFTPLPPTIPAILSYLTLTPPPDQRQVFTSMTSTMAHAHPEFELEYTRGIELGKVELNHCFYEAYRSGSIRGVWEGMFVFADFTVYTQLLAGAPPSIVQDQHFSKHRQIWTLREYHLYANDEGDNNADDLGDLHSHRPIPPGEPLRSYFPAGTRLRESAAGVEARWDDDGPAMLYIPLKEGHTQVQSQRLIDVLVIGESHSSWGQCRLLGRIRPCDGFISLTKEYIDGSRGKWVYRGYLVGDTNPHLAGRWRDTVTPADVIGYEGCFAMRRRS